MKMTKPYLLSISILLLAACGGGGGGSSGGSSSSVVGIDLPDTMSVVASSEESSTKTASAAGIVADTSGYALDSDYVLDLSRSYVYDPSMEPLETVNMILCLMEQTRAADLVNTGSYYALVNEDKCETGQNQSSSGQTGQSSSNVTKYNKWVIESSRADNNSPMVVKMWVPGAGNGAMDPDDAQNVMVELTATESVSSSKPFGAFSMNFAGVIDDGFFGGSPGTYVTMMKGSLQTVENELNQPQFKFINVGGQLANINITDFSFEQATNVVLDDATGSGGVAKTKEAFDDGFDTGEKTFVVAYNNTHLRRAKDDNADNTADVEACVDRDQTNTQVWRYNLYHEEDSMFNNKAVSAGDRVMLNSGFPFRYNDGEQDLDGYVSYWGLWVQDDTALPNGASIDKLNFNDGTTTPYTVNVSPGKLIKRTANTDLVSKYEGEEFSGWANHSSLGDPYSQGYDSWVITVDSNLDFVITGGLSWGETGPQVTDVTDDVITFGFEGENLWLWSDSLGGNVVYVYNSSTLPANRTVTFYNQEFVYPDDSLLANGSITLKCYDRCLKGGLTQTNVDEATSDMDLYYPADYDSTGGYDSYLYTLTVSNGQLILTDNQNGNAVVSTKDLNMSNLGYDWGINTGEMVFSSVSITEPWQIYDQPLSFRWETGPNHWNQLVTVSNANGYVNFDKPLKFNYTLEAGDEANGDPNNKAGKSYLLEYGGSGNLWGFPWQPEAGCDIATEDCRWYSAVTLKNGVRLTDGDGNKFVVKQIESEKSMLEVDISNCSALSIGSLFTDPALDLPQSSDIGDVSFGWIDKPTPANSAPAVVGGELQ